MNESIARPDQLVDRWARLYSEIDVEPELLAPLLDYAAGHATGQARHFRRAFLPSAHVEGVRDGTFVSWDLEAYCRRFTGRPSLDEQERRRTITELGRAGPVAHAAMILEHGADVFTDLFLLVELDGAWRIANKVYAHRRR